MIRSRMRLQLGRIEPRPPSSNVQHLRSIFEELNVVYPSSPSTTACLSPLFTEHFSFESDQYTTLGWSICRHQVADAVASHCLSRQVAVSPHVTKAAVSILCNDYSMRYHAERLGFLNLSSSPLDMNGDTLDLNDFSALMKSLRAPLSGPQKSDLRGTSFEPSPHKFSQSSLGAKLSHLIGCINVHCGRTCARTAARRLFRLDSHDNLPFVIAQHLQSVVEKHHVGPVTMAILAAQGISVRFRSRSLVAEIDVAEAVASSEEANHSQPLDNAVEKAKHSLHFHDSGGSVAPSNVLKSFAATPGKVNFVEKWKRRHGFTVGAGTGWLSEAETPPFEQGQLHFGGSSSAFFADYVGMKMPSQGAYVDEKRFGETVKDPGFHDKDALKDGVPFDTQGMKAADYVKMFSTPHVRKFEVKMVKQDTCDVEDKVLSQAVADRYTVARASACGNYLESLVADLERLSK